MIWNGLPYSLILILIELILFLAFFFIFFAVGLTFLVRRDKNIIMKMIRINVAKAEAEMKSKHCETKSTWNPKITSYYFIRMRF